MSNISGKIALTKLEHAIVTTKKGNKAIMIPIESNDLFLSKLGNVFLDFQAFELSPEKRKEGSKDTHIVSQSLPKKKRESLKKEGKYPPTLGNLINWGETHSGEPTPNNAAPGQTFDPESDDLPF